jgi:hypothetical protein
VDFFTAIELITEIGRRAQVAVAVVAVACFAFWPTPSFNFAWGRALDSVAGTTNLVARVWNIHCTVTQDGWLGRATIHCK